LEDEALDVVVVEEGGGHEPLVEGGEVGADGGVEGGQRGAARERRGQRVVQTEVERAVEHVLVGRDLRTRRPDLAEQVLVVTDALGDVVQLGEEQLVVDRALRVLAPRALGVVDAEPVEAELVEVERDHLVQQVARRRPVGGHQVELGQLVDPEERLVVGAVVVQELVVLANSLAQLPSASWNHGCSSLVWFGTKS
jgi:hypothetical protein